MLWKRGEWTPLICALIRLYAHAYEEGSSANLKDLGRGYRSLENSSCQCFTSKRVDYKCSSKAGVSLAAFRDGINWGTTVNRLEDDIRIQNNPKVLGKQRTEND